MKNILVIGFSTRNIVCSGKKAGYNMYSLDTFCDYDLLECADAAIQLSAPEGFDVKSIESDEIIRLVETFGVEFDAIILGSGFETLEIPNCQYPILRNDIDIMKKVTDKSVFASILKEMGIPQPHLFSLHEKESIKYPVMIKPVCGGGGRFNRILEDQDDINSYKQLIESFGINFSEKDFIIQEYITGVPASVSVISTKEEAFAIAVNEQLIGTTWLTDMPFAYCGNITPFETPFADKMRELAEEMIIKLGLIGSNGIDFIVTEDGPVVIELNARFQGSLDTVEMATGISIFDAHIRSFENELDIQDTKITRYAGRAILYGNKELFVTERIQKSIMKTETADIPNVGHTSYANEPIVSVLATGNTKDEVLNKLKNSVMFIRESLDVKES
jgi:predicted ATP-grasp superfamily ATP-dependent carboligase